MNELLSNKLKPKTINDFIGQKHLLKDDGIIKRMIEKKIIFSMIFFGPPGVGKSSLAKIICDAINIKFGLFNPTKDKKNDLDLLIKNNLNENEKFVIIIDEIHRMNKDKQDILLTYLETNRLIIIGTTTENPYFSIKPAIRSRCQIIPFKPFNQDEVFDYLRKICDELNIKISNDAINQICIQNFSDLRSAINIIDLIYKLYPDKEVDIEIIKKILPSAIIIDSYDGNEYYNLLSAFHKSLRGSDVDASLYYLSRLIKIGDINSINRRIIAMAYEDIGLANPQLLQRVVLASIAAERLGFPEANQILSTTIVELCLSPKSNSAYLAINKALEQLNNGLGNFDIPNHLKDNHYKSAEKLGYYGYKYPHDYPNHWVNQQYLPKEIKNVKFYTPQQNTIEQKMNSNLLERKKYDKSK